VVAQVFFEVAVADHCAQGEDGLLERSHEASDAFQGGRGLPDRIDLGVEDGQVMNAGEELLP
jgi:hypothetical protein